MQNTGRQKTNRRTADKMRLSEQSVIMSSAFVSPVQNKPSMYTDRVKGKMTKYERANIFLSRMYVLLHQGIEHVFSPARLAVDSISLASTL
jgi:hypothetical protein